MTSNSPALCFLGLLWMIDSMTSCKKDFLVNVSALYLLLCHRIVTIFDLSSKFVNTKPVSRGVIVSVAKHITLVLFYKVDKIAKQKQSKRNS